MSVYREYKSKLDNDSTLALLKLDHAPLIFAFIHGVFRAEHAVTRPEGMLIDRLTGLLEEINEAEGVPVFPKPAGHYLDAWVSKGVMNRRHTETLEVVYDVTPAAERALGFVQAIERRETVGAESKLRLIARTLQDLAENSDADVDRRVRTLEAKIAVLREEIHGLNMGMKPKTYSPTEKQERYRLAVDMGRDLQRDFSVIRERFKALARTIAEQYSTTGVNRGDILRRALDENAVLRRSAEGQSFSAFQSFLLDPQSQTELRRLVDEVDQLDAIDPVEKSGRFLRHLPSILLLEAQAVVGTNERLSEQLRRVLDTSNARARAEAQATIREIMALAFEAKQEPPEELVSFFHQPDTVAAEAAIRPLWREPGDPPPMMASEPAPEGDVDAIASILADLATVDFDRLESQVGEGFARMGNGFTLAELLEVFPPQPHLLILDLLGYLELARRDPDYCRLREDSRIRVPLPDASLVLGLPNIEYYQPVPHPS